MRERNFVMNSALGAADWSSQVLLLLAGGERTARPASSPNRLFKTTDKPAIVPLRRRVPIVAWQVESWTRKILVGRVRPGAAEKVRVLRLKRS
jgi:hypothetical protein